MTTYNAPVEEMMFLFNYLKDNKNYNEIEKFKEINSDLVKDILNQAAKLNQEIVHPLAKIGDENPCVYENGVVRSPPGYKEAYTKFINDGHLYLVTRNMGAKECQKQSVLFLKKCYHLQVYHLNFIAN